MIRLTRPKGSGGSWPSSARPALCVTSVVVGGATALDPNVVRWTFNKMVTLYAGLAAVPELQLLSVGTGLWVSPTSAVQQVTPYVLEATYAAGTTAAGNAQAYRLSAEASQTVLMRESYANWPGPLTACGGGNVTPIPLAYIVTAQVVGAQDVLFTWSSDVTVSGPPLNLTVIGNVPTNVIQVSANSFTCTYPSTVSVNDAWAYTTDPQILQPTVTPQNGLLT